MRPGALLKTSMTSCICKKQKGVCLLEQAQLLSAYRTHTQETALSSLYRVVARALMQEKTERKEIGK